ncbi:MAG: hypothetical protein HAW62_03740 [Endozoicomonadaceae bacterium]|nr:hypothetical protein [Endozoicomonadaceae bacterium]
MMRMQSNELGFGLIDNLLALFIFTVTALGFLSVQFLIKRQSIYVEYHSQAIDLARNMAETILHNKQFNIDPSVYDNPDPARKACNENDCTPEEKVKNQIFRWNYSIGMALPHGLGLVCRSTEKLEHSDVYDLILQDEILSRCTQTGNIYTIHIIWSNNPAIQWTRDVGVSLGPVRHLLAGNSLDNHALLEPLKLTKNPHTTASHIQIFVP